MAKKPTDEKQEVPNPRKGGSWTVQPDGGLKKNKPGAVSKPPAQPKPSAETSDDGGQSGGE